MITVAIIGLLAAIAVPNYVRAREASLGNTCIENLRMVDAAIQQWALEKGIGSDQSVQDAALKEYLRPGRLPVCPMGQPYVFSANIGTAPIVSCPVGDSANPPHRL